VRIPYTLVHQRLPQKFCASSEEEPWHLRMAIAISTAIGEELDRQSRLILIRRSTETSNQESQLKCSSDHGRAVKKLWRNCLLEKKICGQRLSREDEVSFDAKSRVFRKLMLKSDRGEFEDLPALSGHRLGRIILDRPFWPR
jgi:hypothetical protein